MTTIIAVETPNGVIFGSDTQATYGSSKNNLDHAKFFTNGEVTFGVAGSLELVQTLKYIELPDIPQDIDFWVNTTLVTGVVNMFIGLAQKYDVTPNEVGAVIVSIRGRVYEISNFGEVIRTTRKYYSIGSGSTWAESVLSTVKNPTVKDVKRALEHAALNDIYTSGPFHVELIKSGN